MNTLAKAEALVNAPVVELYVGFEVPWLMIAGALNFIADSVDPVISWLPLVRYMANDGTLWITCVADTAFNVDEPVAVRSTKLMLPVTFRLDAVNAFNDAVPALCVMVLPKVAAPV